jgi:uncharacterized membrane protein YfcA
MYPLLTLLGAAVGAYGTLIGGGPLQVPALVYLLDFLLPVATATSQFMLLIMSSLGSVAHLLAGSFVRGHWRTLKNKSFQPSVHFTLLCPLPFLGNRVNYQY